MGEKLDINGSFMKNVPGAFNYPGPKDSIIKYANNRLIMVALEH
jgi:hypothetical protein